MILQDKIVVVTGASEGIGRAIAERLAREGAKLALVARSEDKLQEVARFVGGEAFACDIRDSTQVKRTVDAIIAKYGRIDVLVNSAGIWQKKAQLDSVSDELIADVIATNLAGTIYMTKSVLAHLRRTHAETAIIQVVSKSGIVAQEGQSVYTATKYGVKGFTDVLRVDLKDTNIRIGAVYQSGTDTQMFAKAGEHFSQDKLTEPADLADAVAYMLTRPPKMWLPEIQVTY
jgi:3-oxoacyl-[acyl-carrier protein] reductase